MTDKSEKMQKDIWEFWTEFNENMNDQFDQMIEDSVENYEKAYEMWKEYQDKLSKQMDDFISSETQESKVNIFEKWMDMTQEYYKNLEEFGWKEQQEDFVDQYTKYVNMVQGKMMEELFKSMSEEQKDLYEIWMDEFEPFGEEKEGMRNLMGELMKLNMKSMNNFINVFMKSFSSSEEKDLYKNIQQQWLDSTGEFYKTLFESTPFAYQMGEGIDTYLTNEETRQEMMERFLKMNGLPTRSDIRSVYEALHELTTRIRKIERKFDELSENK